MGHGTVYRFFPSKRALATQVVGARGAIGFLQMEMDRSQKHYNPKELLTAIGSNYLGNLEERLPLVRFSIAEALSNEDLAKQYYDNLLQKLFDGLADTMSAFQDKGVLRDGDPFMLGHIFYSMLFGYLYAQELLYGREKTHMNKEELINEVVDIFLNGVLPKKEEKDLS
jgi:AcrR family transcriptional regulator